ncbi:MAG: RnfABCDGE type electron transport complex subunit G [Tyzzerella sp.]|nr:RnfABCDGE type electron transport complex subunit G [Tyzzerella sp.]
MKNILKNTLILTAITLVAGILLGLVYEITKEPIALAKEAAKKEAYQQVMADADAFDSLELVEKTIKEVEDTVESSGCIINEVVEAKANGETVGYVVTTTTSEGYGGEIQISVGILKDGTVNGVAILSIGETAGLGMKATEEEFYGQYAGKNVEFFTVTKTGASSDEEIDALSGATITSNAMTKAVNSAVVYYKHALGGSANE